MPLPPPLLTAEAYLAQPSHGPDALARPFVKWVGGKRSVLPAILNALGELEGRYFEPFVGGGAVFFAMMQTWPVRGAVINDANERLVRTWRAVRDDVDGVLARLEEHEREHCQDWFYEVRKRDIDAAPTDAEVAAWLIYLNKTGFNGLYRVNSKGIYNVPMGSYDAPRIRDEPNLRKVHQQLQGVEIRHGDFVDACEGACPGDTVYFDPPYVPLSRSAQFTSYTRGGFGQDDQRRLADFAAALVARGVRVLLSNHDTPGLRDLYKDHFELMEVRVRRSVNRDGARRGAVNELLICSR